MKVSELEDYRDDKPTKTRLEVRDRIIHIKTGQEYIIAYFGNSLYGVTNLEAGHPWKWPIIEIEGKFTKADVVSMLGNLDDWEVKE